MKRALKPNQKYTRCPHCQTLYLLSSKINLNHLTKVSCGSCHDHFIAQDHIAEPRGNVVPANKKNLFQARLSRVPVKSSAKSVEPSPVIPSKVSPTKNALARLYKPGKSSPNKWGWATAFAGVFLALNLGIGSLVWLQSGKLSQNATVQNVLTNLCGYLGCNVGNYYHASTLVIQQHELDSDPADPSKLQLHALIKNTSGLPQPLTNLQMKIEDLAGNVINILTFSPAEYAATVGNKMLEAGQTTSITVSVNQPTPDLFSYQVNFI